MGKSKIKMSLKLKNWIENIKDPILVLNGETISCEACNKKLTCSRKSQLVQHLNTAVHKMNLKCRAVQNDATIEPNRKNQFYLDMCQAMIAVKMPWRSLDKETWRGFLQKYITHTIPDDSTLRKNYLEDCYILAIQQIRDDIADSYVWISVDETTDTLGRYIANLIVGKLCEAEEPPTPHLLACEQLPKTNSDTIARFVNNALRMLWSNSDNDEKVLLLVTDAAQYMLKAGEILKCFYPNLIHLTCLAHGLNRVAEEIRQYFPNVNKLISSVKKVFLKAPLRIEMYREILPNTPLPPQPILTRWGTWLEAAIFYANNLKKIKEVVMLLNADDSSYIASAQKILQSKTLMGDLVFIKTHFESLPNCIIKLESGGLPLTDSITFITNTFQGLRATPGRCGQIISTKIDAVSKRNPAFGDILKVAKILSGDHILETDVQIPSHFWSKFKYAPVTSCDVERSFSAYKLILTDKRYSFSIQNLEKTIVVYCALNYN